MMDMDVGLDGLPGEELITKGIDDLERGEDGSAEALLVSMARTKFKGMGLPIPAAAFAVDEAELKLYALLCETHANPYREYNALRHRLGRFDRALQARISRHARRESI